MAATPDTESQTALSDYERQQLREIAAWKEERPGVMSGVIGRVASSAGKLTDALLPDVAIEKALGLINQAAGHLNQDDSVLKDKMLDGKGISRVDLLAEQPLDFVDHLADRCITEAGHMAAGMGAATGAGGPISVAVGIPTLLFAALRLIHRVSSCYGNTFTPEQEPGVMMGVLTVALATTPQQRAQAMEGYRQRIETSFIQAAMEESTNKALQRLVLGQEIGAIVPGFNIAVNAYVNRQFILRIGTAAKRIFQEQWLREKGKIE